MQYVARSVSVYYPNDEAKFTTSGAVTQGTASRTLTQSVATLSADGNTLLLTNS